MNVLITGYGSAGEGVGRLDNGKVVFVRGAAGGDELTVRLTKEQPRIAWAEIEKIIEPSKHRTEPNCPYYPSCGGCDFRHITYEEELRAKLLRVNDALSRIGGTDVRAEQILTTGEKSGYRNKAVLHNDGDKWGFYASGTHDVIEVEHCDLLAPELNDFIAKIKSKTARRENLKEITLRCGLNGINPPYEYLLDGLMFEAVGFFQVNTKAAQILFTKAREFAALTKDELLLDLYCGVGSMAIFVGRDAGKIVGVERNPDSIKAANENAKRNKIENAQFIAADAENWDEANLKPDCIIVDPPRSGLSKQTIKKILGLRPERIVYVSCDPATMARDIRLMEGYTLKQVTAVDMFPRTANVECVALMTRR